MLGVGIFGQRPVLGGRTCLPGCVDNPATFFSLRVSVGEGERREQRLGAVECTPKPTHASSVCACAQIMVQLYCWQMQRVFGPSSTTATSPEAGPAQWAHFTEVATTSQAIGIH